MNPRIVIAISLISLLTTVTQATLVFDTITGGGPNYSSGLPGSTIADVLDLPAINPDQYYRIEKIRVALIQRPTLPTNRFVQMDIQAFASWTGATSGNLPVFSDTIGSVTWNIRVLPETEVVYLDCLIDLAGSGLAFDMRPGASRLPLQLRGYITDVDVQNDLTFGLVDRASLVPGSWSPEWFYRDTDANQLLTGSDARHINGWSNTNLWAQVEASVVPEPASMAVLGLGLAALRRRRKG